MSNERQRQVSTPVVLAEDNIKQTETKGYLLPKKKQQHDKYYLKQLTHITDG